MKFKKETIKAFFIGFAVALAIVGIIFAGIKIGDKQDKRKKAQQEESYEEFDDKKETIDGVTYYIDSEEKSDFKCDNYKNVLFDQDYYFVTDDGSIYLRSDKKYTSTKQNCKLLDDKVKIRSFVNRTLIAVDGKKYYVEYSESDSTYILKKSSDSNGITHPSLYKDDVKYAIRYDGIYDDKTGIDNEEYYVLRTDGKLYHLTYGAKWMPNDKYTYTNVKDEVYQSFDNEIIKKFYVTKYENEGYIITDKSIYRQVIANEECKDYEDIKCTYKFIKDNYLSKYTSNLLQIEQLYSNHATLLTLDGKRIEIGMRKENNK